MVQVLSCLCSVFFPGEAFVKVQSEVFNRFRLGNGCSVHVYWWAVNRSRSERKVRWFGLIDIATDVTVLWPFFQAFSKHSSTEIRNFLRHFPADSYLKNNCNKTDVVPQCTWGDARYYITVGHKCVSQQQTRWFIAQVCYHRQLKLISRLKTVRESLHGHVIRGALAPYVPPDLSPCDFYLRGHLKDKVHKTILTIWKN